MRSAPGWAGRRGGTNGWRADSPARPDARPQYLGRRAAVEGGAEVIGGDAPERRERRRRQHDEGDVHAGMIARVARQQDAIDERQVEHRREQQPSPGVAPAEPKRPGDKRQGERRKERERTEDREPFGRLFAIDGVVGLRPGYGRFVGAEEREDAAGGEAQLAALVVSCGRGGHGEGPGG